MKKRGLILVFLFAMLLTFSNLVIAENGEIEDETAKVTKAYDCLRDELIKDSCSDETLDEKLFSVLALGNYKDCKSKLLDDSKNNECWPKENCKLKETAIALLALEKAGENTNKIESWLLNQTTVASDLIWYLQIESSGATKCAISYESGTYNIDIGEDKKISSNAGTCLSLAQGNYWLEIATRCLEKQYKINCENDFETTLLYKTRNSPTIHVSQNIQSGSAGSELIEEVKYKCFEEKGSCNYEGSLWAVLALEEVNEDTSEFLPYIEAFVDENKKYFPETFLYISTGSEEYFDDIIKDFNEGFWKRAMNTKFYNTALALLSLQNQETNEELNSKEKILALQNNKGCFTGVNKKETAFLLWSAWPKGTGGGGDDECVIDDDCLEDEECLYGTCFKISEDDCESQGNYCSISSEYQCEQLGGVSFIEQECSFGMVCCSVDLPTCSEQNGYSCDYDEECPLEGDTLPSSDGTCCSVECVEDIPIPDPVLDCYDDLDCDEGYICNDDDECVKESKSYWWIWVLLILIIITIMAIVFKDKIRLFLFKRKNKFKKTPGPEPIRPPFQPPRMGMPRPMNMMRPRTRVITRNVPVRGSPLKLSKDNELDETLKKLKKISEGK